MEHKINIQPTDETATPPPSLPDRSDLSKLYAQGVAVTTQELKEVKQVMFLDMRTGRVNLLLVLPAIATFLNVHYILTNAASQNTAAGVLFPLISFSLTGVMLLVWFVSLKMLSTEFRNYNFSLTTFLVGYLFYALPLISLVITMSPDSWRALALLLLGYSFVNYGLVAYIAKVIGTDKTTKTKVVLLALPVILLVVANVIAA